MTQNNIDGVLDHLRRIKSGADRDSFKIDVINELEMELRFLTTFIKYHNVLLNDFSFNISNKVKLIVKVLHIVFDGIPNECKRDLNLERLESQLLESIFRYNYELKDSYLPEYMDCLGKNLNDVLMCLDGNTSDHSLTNRFIKQLKIVQKKMRFLRYLYVSEINGCVEHEKLEGLETQIQFMADNVGQLCFSFWVWRNKEKEEKENLSRKPPYLIFLVVLVELAMQKVFVDQIKASKFTQSRTFKDKILPKGFSNHLCNLLVYLRNEKLNNFPTNVAAQNIDLAIEFLLAFLGDVPNHVINGKWLNEVLANIGVLVGDILCVIQMLLAESTIKEDASKIDLYTIKILEKIEDQKAQVEERCKSFKYSPSNEFPTLGGLSFLDSLQRKLNDMLKSESSLDFLMKPHIGILEKELSSLTSVFRDVSKVQHKHDEIRKDLQRRAVNLAYEAEVSIDSILAKYDALWHSFCSLPAIIEEINHINVEVTKMRSVNLALRPFFVVEPSKHLPPQHSNLMNDEEIVGFEDDTKIIIRHLTRGTSELDVIPIVGMGGQGKTTCAKKLYNNDIIVSHFDVRAWCIISQTYNRIELLKDIFSQVSGSKGDKDDVLAEMLKKSLMGKRYLIVLDDMWDGMAWDDLRLCFPDVGNRSRIVVTTRLEEVAKQAKHRTDPYYLPFLKPDESLKLLQKKVFQQEDCPPELQDVSQEIAERCKGLPLVIVLVAGIIKRKKMEVSWWDEVKNSLLFYLGESEGYSLSTMQLSYNNLPEYLKPCLLYMGMFPEDAEIPVSRLMSLWIAEDFVQNIESGRLIEEAAEGYLTELISSNVVMVSKREYNGKVKYCQVHDLVLHFCLEKCREEKFMLAVKGKFRPLDRKGSRVSFSFSKEHSKFASLCSKTRKPLHQYLRSLITTNGGEHLFWNPFCQVSKVRLLKVLDLSSHRAVALSSVTLKPLIHLKYLAVRAYEFDFHPESHLLHLETLIVEDVDCMVLPASFWKMGKLRHVDVFRAEFDMQGILEESPKLENLRKLRRVVIFNADSVDVLLHKCPNLQELDICCSSWICVKWESLTKLQILCLSLNYSRMGESYPVLSRLQLLSSLKELVLRSFPIQSSIPFIEGLSSLEYLHLEHLYSIESKEWCLGGITFHNLKLLKLKKLDISRWDASEESFPLLETLVIKECEDLQEIPLSFTDIPTLKQIKLIRCKNESLEASAAKIKEDVEENEGNDRIDLIIIKQKHRQSIAGALDTKGNEIEAWELFHGRVVDKLQGSYSENEHLKRLLNICYQDLPFYLKSCFTYLSIMPKNHVIDKMRLIQQWASEGLVLEREGKAIAQVAESYLNELANRKLIQVAKKYPDGRLEPFTIHNLWYEIILSKSGEETIKPQEVRYLVITDKLAIDIQDIDQFKHLQSLTTLGYSFTNSILLKLLSGSFKLLKVLDLPGAPLVNIPEEFFELVNLKFMNLSNTKIKVLPRSIRKLESLEFLDLRETLVDKLPDEILRLQHLRHVFVYRWGSAGFLHGFKAPKKIGTMVSLEMVNLVNATTSIVIELGKLMRLRMLNIAKLRKKHGKDLCSSLDRLINLEQLSISSCEVNDIIDLHYPLSSTHSSLRTLVFEGSLERLPQWVMSLHALAVVHLKWSKLVDSTLQETLQDLPNLVKLVLDRAYEGEELRFGAGGFKKLKDLRIHHFTKLRWIKVEEGAMTSLVELQLRDCRLMEELPSGIEHLSSLKYLSLEQMPVKLLMTVKSWKIAHIPGVNIQD